MDSIYGVHPSLKPEHVSVDKQVTDPLVPLDDRIKNLEALTLGFLAENSLPLTLVPKLLTYAQVSGTLSFLLSSSGLDSHLVSLSCITFYLCIIVIVIICVCVCV